MKACPTGCPNAAPPGMLMCYSCWKRVPQHLRGPVYATWKAWMKDMGDADKMHAYEAAAAAAVSAAA